MRSFDPELLRTLVAFAETGTLAQAATIVGRSPSAVTAQMQRLEDAVGKPLLTAAGRRRNLTETGDLLVGYARRILAAQNDAWQGLTGAASDSWVRIGMTQDFADTELPRHLNTFARLHPRMRIDLRVGRTADLAEDLKAGRIDLILAMRLAVSADEITVVREPMSWLCATDGLIGEQEELPLALLDQPCAFRDAALRALEESGRPYRLAATSTSLSGLWAAVRAGIAVTVRTSRWLQEGIAEAPPHLKLPKLPDAEFCIRMRRDADESARHLANVLADGISHGRKA